MSQGILDRNNVSIYTVLKNVSHKYSYLNLTGYHFQCKDFGNLSRLHPIKCSPDHIYEQTTGVAKAQFSGRCSTS